MFEIRCSVPACLTGKETDEELVADEDHRQLARDGALDAHGRGGLGDMRGARWRRCGEVRWPSARAALCGPEWEIARDRNGQLEIVDS